jgi:hypothetical protein
LCSSSSSSSSSRHTRWTTNSSLDHQGGQCRVWHSMGRFRVAGGWWL